MQRFSARNLRRHLALEWDLVVNVPGRRRVTIVNGKGVVTPAGEYYYEKTGQEVPKNFDQRPTRKGQREMIRLLDGTSRAVSIWSAGAWKQTNLGKKFYSNTTVRYVVSFLYLWT